MAKLLAKMQTRPTMLDNKRRRAASKGADKEEEGEGKGGEGIRGGRWEGYSKQTSSIESPGVYQLSRSTAFIEFALF